jgi:DNA repair exonuclease SbcCD ATPase subunit
MDLALRCALAAAGRSRGLRAPQADTIERLNREIASIDPDVPDLREARRRVAEAGEDLASLEAQVDRLSGRLAERRDAGQSTADLEARLADRTRELTEAETEAIAAREALERAEERARAARDARERRLSLVDRRENRRREARSWFLDRLEEPFRRALAALPVEAEPTSPATFEDDSIAAALAVARLGDPRAPIVLIDAPFETAVAARGALTAPVILASV